MRSGTQVSEGSGRILVAATGMHSEWGKTMQLVGNAGSEDTPLQEKLADLAAAIGKIGFGVAVACFIALLIKWCVGLCALVGWVGRQCSGSSCLEETADRGWMQAKAWG